MPLDYLHFLRSRVGRRKILMVFASACVEDDAGRLLWQQRGDFGWWGLPGGILEYNEDLETCVVREVYEETGLHVVPTRLVGVYSSPDYDVRYPNGDEVQQITFCYACRITAGHLVADGDETRALAWFAPDECPPTAPWYAAMAADWAAHLPHPTFDRGSPGHAAGEAYGRILRRFIGPAGYIQPRAAAAVWDAEERLLLYRRRDSGRWALPGGDMQLGERLDMAAVRAVSTKSGVLVVPTRVLAVYSDPAAWTFRVEQEHETRVILGLFACRATCIPPLHPTAHALDIGFFSPQALPPLDERFGNARLVQDAIVAGPPLDADSDA
nr:NUDIX domain-containing protein [Ardenticatena sp.]